MKKLILTLLLISICSLGYSEGLIDLNIIAKIESNNNIWAYNPKSKARGLYQITPICLEDYNNYYWTPQKLLSKEIILEDLWKPEINEKIAKWYLEKRIPQLLKHYKLEVNIKNVLWAYNAGIGRVIKGIMPKETKNYIKKYLEIRRER